MWKSNFIFRQRHSQLFPSYSQDTARRDSKINCLWMVEFVQVLFKINWPQKVKKKKTVTRYWWTLFLAKFVGQVDEPNVRAKAAENGFWLVEDETIASKRMLLEAQIEVKMEFCFCNISPNFRRSRKHSKLWMSWISF